MKKIYFKNLDALRFMAAFAVMGEHITRSFYFPDTPWKNAFIILLSMDGTGAEMGVSFFFVLSGFLISYLLIEEFENTGTLQVKQFYIRRTLRIWPLYFITLFIGFVIHPVLDKSLIELANWKMYATFLTNFDHIYSNWPQSGILGVQWSLAVEEQFYLLWPLLIFMLLPRKRLFPVILIALIGFSLVYKLSGGHKYHTLTCLAPLMTGSLLAYGCYYFPRQVEKFTSRLTRQSTLLIYGLSLGLIFFQYKISHATSKISGLEALVRWQHRVHGLVPSDAPSHTAFAVCFQRLGRLPQRLKHKTHTVQAERQVGMAVREAFRRVYLL